MKRKWFVSLNINTYWQTEVSATSEAEAIDAAKKSYKIGALPEHFDEKIEVFNAEESLDASE